MTEKLFTGTLNHNKNKNKKKVYLSLMLMYSPMLTFEESKVRRFHPYGVAHEIEIRIIPPILHQLHFYKVHGQIISVTI